jgi:hypothetical protein
VEYERKSDHLDHTTLEKNQKNQVRGEERERLKKNLKKMAIPLKIFSNSILY